MYKWSLYNKNHTSITCYINFNLVSFLIPFVIETSNRRREEMNVKLSFIGQFGFFHCINPVEKESAPYIFWYQIKNRKRRERRRKTNKDKRNSNIFSSVWARQEREYWKWLSKRQRRSMLSDQFELQIKIFKWINLETNKLMYKWSIWISEWNSQEKKNLSCYFNWFELNIWTFSINHLRLSLFTENSHIDLFSNRPQPKKKRKSRTAFTNHQIFELEKRFLYQKYLSPADRDEIAAALGLTNAQVSFWWNYYGKAEELVGISHILNTFRQDLPPSA